MPKTKLVVTVGPASRDPVIFERIVRAGASVVRLNFSHGSHEEHLENIQMIRETEEKVGRPLAILQDLSGPKIRIGVVAEGVIELVEGNQITLTTRDVPGEGDVLSVTHKGLPSDVEAGDSLLLADGQLEVQVLKVDGEDIICEVVSGGPLSSRKGINLPGKSLNIPSMSDKDRADLAFGIENGVDFVALSFVRTAEDVLQAKQLIEDHGGHVPLIAKIEKHEAITNIDAITHAADGVMVARGDLGIEIPLEQVPMAQKMIIEKANHEGKPVITATQMMRSMIDHPRPTRAEVTDVANAIFDGSDAIMLSDETTIGQFPVETVETMARIAREVEDHFPHALFDGRYDDERAEDFDVAVSKSAYHMTTKLHLDLIVCFTYEGRTARLLSRLRPQCHTLALTPELATCRRMCLTWGVRAYQIAKLKDTDVIVEMAREAALASKLAKPGQHMVITSGVPITALGHTNTITIDEI